VVDYWIQNFPVLQKEAITAALETGSLVKARQAMRLLEELDSKLRGPSLTIEILSTYNLEPILPVLNFALSCLPAQSHLQLAPLDSIEAHIAQSRARELFDARIIIWRAEEVLPEGLFPLSHGFPGKMGDRIEQAIERVERIVTLHERRMHGVPLHLYNCSATSFFERAICGAASRGALRSGGKN
jgi:hypothetical protein